MGADDNKRSSAPVAIGGIVPIMLPLPRRDFREWQSDDRKRREEEKRLAPAKTRVDLPTQPVDRSTIFSNLGLSLTEAARLTRGVYAASEPAADPILRQLG